MRPTRSAPWARRSAERAWPGATSAVPPEPPAEMMPASRLWRLIQASNASAMAVIAAPRSPVNTAFGAARMIGARPDGRHVGRRRSARRRKIDQEHAHAGIRDLVANEAQFVAFGVERAGDNDRRERRRDAIGRNSTAGAPQWRRARRGGARARRPPRSAPPAPAATSASAKSGWRCRRGSGRVASPAAVRPCGRSGRLERRPSSGGSALAVLADAEQPLLQFAIGFEPRRLHQPVDPAVDHDRDFLGHRGGDADILLDDKHADIAFLAEAEQDSSTCSTITGARPSVGSSMIRRCGLSSSAREIASICCSPPESWLPRLCLPLGQPRESVVDARDRPWRRGVAGGEPQMLVDGQRAATAGGPAAHSRGRAARSRPASGRSAPRP